MKKAAIALLSLFAVALSLIWLNIQHTKARVEAVLAELETFDENEGAFQKLKHLESVCGTACFVTTQQECDPGLCAVALGFNNKWGSTFALAPEVSLRGNITVAHDLFEGFMLEYSVRPRHSKEGFAVISIVREKPKPRLPIETRWKRDMEWRGGIATGVTLHITGAQQEKECALALNVSCLDIGSKCSSPAELAPCATSRSVSGP